ncbi:ABC transporter membrane-spanning protein [soil metagenome]
MTTPAGYGVLLRANLRRDALQVLAWVLGVTLLYWSQAISIDGLYTSQAQLDDAAASMGGNAAFVAMAGPARALDTVGGQVVWQAAAIGAVLVGLMSMFLVGRHTRVEEEQGREELLRSAPVGRFAPVSAAATVAVLANLVVGLGVAASLVGYGLSPADSWATGLGLTLTGWVFTGTALVAVQLSASARSAYGVAGSVIGVSYALRAVGDVTGSGLSWLTPIGWYQALHPFSGLRWWPAMLLVVAAGCTGALACALLVRRDVGSGLLAARPGPARGALGSGFALTWRLQRPSVIGWSTGLLLTGLAYGSIGDSVADLVGDSQTSRDLFAVSGADLVDGFYATSALMLALLATGFAISSSLRLRSEEDDGRAELLLTAGLSRRGWYLAHAAVTAAGSVLVLVAGGIGIGAGYGLATGGWGRVLRLSLPTLSYLPSVLVCVGLALLLTGLLPRWARAAWALLGWAAVVLLLGRTLHLPGWLQGLSPFDHPAAVPAEAFAAAPVVVLALLATALGVAAWLTLSRRDIL